MMSTSSIEYGYIEGVESLEDYRPGGYHPFISTTAFISDIV